MLRWWKRLFAKFYYKSVYKGLWKCLCRQNKVIYEELTTMDRTNLEYFHKQKDGKRNKDMNVKISIGATKVSKKFYKNVYVDSKGVYEKLMHDFIIGKVLEIFTTKIYRCLCRQCIISTLISHKLIFDCKLALQSWALP